MEVVLDGTRIDDVSPRSETLRQALLDIQSRHCGASQMVVGLSCNGEAVAGEQMEEALEKRACGIELLDITTSTAESLVYDAMTQASISLEYTESSVQSVANQLTEGRTDEAIKALSECLQVWQQVHMAVAHSIQMLEIDMKEMMILDETLMDVIAKPKDILTQVKGALQAQDHVLLADLLQYEFSTVTEKWHTIIARLRQEADDRRDCDATTT